ncbi:hypothetical protein [Actinomadura sp. DC4]|uniref:hypothetical protein n=1 Tax=Actinomadura sp. DC4 TaxID=3055069 RepID=UPI0025B17960|nr:hypothetical protein [Actinomadura sp. DC4]MDN3356050.1 hypothetical protein [Actinomadura sp. DC4]
MKYRVLSAAAVITAAVALVLAGCGSGGAAGEPNGNPTAPFTSADSSQDLTVVHVKVDGGPPVTCVIYDGYRAGGLSCDWGAR